MEDDVEMEVEVEVSLMREMLNEEAEMFCRSISRSLLPSCSRALMSASTCWF